ncbi:MAG: hypothetical protein JWO11_3517 [Nocardioides sp.]|nr:hypothetical protein [Nocardioides sp.]
MSEVSRDQERWLPVVGHEGHYEVSDMGRVRSVDRVIPRRAGGPQRLRGHVMKTPVSEDRYRIVKLGNGTGRYRTHWVHKLVLTAFIGSRPDGMVACHGPGGSLDNRLSNLRWDTQSGNLHDMRLHGTNPQVNKSRCTRKHLLVEPNLRGDVPDGHRGCLSCHRALAAVRYARNHGRALDVILVSDEKYRQIMGDKT